MPRGNLLEFTACGNARGSSKKVLEQYRSKPQYPVLLEPSSEAKSSAKAEPSYEGESSSEGGKVSEDEEEFQEPTAVPVSKKDVLKSTKRWVRNTFKYQPEDLVFRFIDDPNKTPTENYHVCEKFYRERFEGKFERNSVEVPAAGSSIPERHQVPERRIEKSNDGSFVEIVACPFCLKPHQPAERPVRGPVQISISNNAQSLRVNPVGRFTQKPVQRSSPNPQKPNERNVQNQVQNSMKRPPKIPVRNLCSYDGMYESETTDNWPDAMPPGWPDEGYSGYSAERYGDLQTDVPVGSPDVCKREHFPDQTAPKTNGKSQELKEVEQPEQNLLSKKEKKVKEAQVQMRAEERSRASISNDDIYHKGCAESQSDIGESKTVWAHEEADRAAKFQVPFPLVSAMKGGKQLEAASKHETEYNTVSQQHNASHSPNLTSPKPQVNDSNMSRPAAPHRHLAPPRSVVVIREDVFEVADDPHPNAYFDERLGLMRVYHGQAYGNPNLPVAPTPGGGSRGEDGAGLSHQAAGRTSGPRGGGFSTVRGMGMGGSMSGNMGAMGYPLWTGGYYQPRVPNHMLSGGFGAPVHGQPGVPNRAMSVGPEASGHGQHYGPMGGPGYWNQGPLHRSRERPVSNQGRNEGPSGFSRDNVQPNWEGKEVPSGISKDDHQPGPSGQPSNDKQQPNWEGKEVPSGISKDDHHPNLEENECPSGQPSNDSQQADQEGNKGPEILPSSYNQHLNQRKANNKQNSRFNDQDGIKENNASLVADNRAWGPQGHNNRAPNVLPGQNDGSDDFVTGKLDASSGGNETPVGWSPGTKEDSPNSRPDEAGDMGQNHNGTSPAHGDPDGQGEASRNAPFAASPGWGGLPGTWPEEGHDANPGNGSSPDNTYANIENNEDLGSKVISDMRDWNLNEDQTKGKEAQNDSTQQAQFSDKMKEMRAKNPGGRRWAHVLESTLSQSRQPEESISIGSWAQDNCAEYVAAPDQGSRHGAGGAKSHGYGKGKGKGKGGGNSGGQAGGEVDAWVNTAKNTGGDGGESSARGVPIQTGAWGDANMTSVAW